MATSLASGPVTIKQYLKFKAPAGYRDELVFGRIIVSPEPKPLHFDIADNIYKLLSAVAGKKWKVAQRVNLRFPTSVSMPSPDVFVTSHEAWRKARDLSGYPDGSETILAAEVLSPSNRKKAVQSKIDLYQEYEIEAWVVHPKSQTIEVFRQQEVLSFDLKEDKTIPLPASLGGKPLSIARIFDLAS